MSTRKKTCLTLPLWLACLFVCLVCFVGFVCDKTDKQDTPEPVIFETTPIEVEIPKTNWDKTLVILPLETESSEQDAASWLMTEQITSILSGSHNLKVIRVPSESWIGENGVEADYILEAEVLEKDEVLRMRFILTDIKADSILWSEEIEEELESMFIVSEEASAEVQEKLGSGAPEWRSGDRIPSDVMKRIQGARDLMGKRQRQDTDQAIQAFKTILREDSTSTAALVGLAECYLQIVMQGWDQNMVWLRLAQDASLKALEFEEIPTARVALGQVHLWRGDRKHAEEAFRQALASNANLVEAWSGLAQVLTSYGLYGAVLEVYDNILDINPGDSHAAMSRALILIGQTRYAEAGQTLDRIINLLPGYNHLHSVQALVYYYEGNSRKAKESLQVGLGAEILQPFSHAVLAMIHAHEKKFDEALGELELEVKPYAGNDASLATAVAAIYTLLGQKGMAIEWLEKAVGWGYREYPWLMNDPNFHDLQGDERFSQLMESLKQQWEDRRAGYSSL